MKLYRLAHSWLHAFTAFRLPSPFSVAASAGAASVGGASAGGSARAEANASIRRICREAELPEDEACRQLLQMLHRAEKFCSDGADPRSAWGRASLEWPELKSQRRLVELLLVWKTASGNLERRFRRLKDIRCLERAQLLDTSVENCVLVEQAPPSKLLRQWSVRLHQPSQTISYLTNIERLQRKLYGHEKVRIRRAERRDAGTTRELASTSGAPETEAAFGRKRAAAIADAVAASSCKRARMIRNAPLGLAPVAQQVADANARDPVAASAHAVAQVAKREAQAKKRNLRGADAAAKARGKRERKVMHTATQPLQGRDANLAAARSVGIALVCLADGDARAAALRLRFEVTRDPLDFVAKVSRSPVLGKKGHLVIAYPVDTDYFISARIAAALLGAFYTTPKDFLVRDGLPPGIQYSEKVKTSTATFHVAVSAGLASEFPTVPLFLRAVAMSPKSCWTCYVSAHKLCKLFV